MIDIRPAETDADLEAWRQVRLLAHPDQPSATVEELRGMEKPDRTLLLAELDGAVVGSGLAQRGETQRGFVMPRVVPAARGRGVGTAMLETLVPIVARLGVPELAANVEGRDDRSQAFARKHGFEEIDRQVQQVKTLGDEPAAAPPLPEGVEVVTVAERPELLREAYDLACEGFADMKFVGASARISLDDFLRDEATLPGGSLVALADGEIVGFAGLMRWTGEPHLAENGLTVVRRAWRGRGLAPALKRRQLAWAAANGIREVTTWTQRGNENMQLVNERLGYVTRNVSLTFVKRLP